MTPTSALQVSSPVSLIRVLRFGLAFLAFLAVQAMGTLAQRYLGSIGVLSVSFLGGLASSASAAAAVAKLGASGQITAALAGVATVVASISSAFLNLPLVFQATKDQALTRKLGVTTLVCILAGLCLMALAAWIEMLVS